MIQVNRGIWVHFESINAVELTIDSDLIYVGGQAFVLDDEYYESVFAALGIIRKTDNG